jgi:ABC-type glycerol-3-phosphate transport system permease component
MSLIHYALIAVVLVYLTLRAVDRGRGRGRAGRFARWAVITAGALLVLAPFVWIIPAVFKTGAAFNDYVFFPPVSKWGDTMSLWNFHKLFEGRPSPRGQVYFWEYLLNSTVIATVTTTSQIFLSSLAGYALAKFEFRGKALLTLFMLGSMMIPPVLLLAPLYKMVVDLGLVDSLAGVIVPLMVSTYGAFLFRQACVSVPNEMLDAARLDGCSEIGIYFRVVMPLVRPMAAAFCLVAFLANWNAFFQPNIFLHSEDKLTVPVVLNLLLGVYRQKQGVFLAGTALAMIPPAVLFFFLQKEFISGLTSGAVKG